MSDNLNEEAMNQLIEAMREAQGHKTMTEFAEELGISQSYLSMIYAGDREPGRKLLMGLKRIDSKKLDEAIDVFLTNNITVVRRSTTVANGDEQAIRQPDEALA